MSEEKTHLHVKPKNPKACIRDPRSRVRLPAVGARVSNSPFWRARLRDGDVVLLTAEELATKKQAQEAFEAAEKAAQESAAKAEDATPKPAGKAKKGQ